MADERMLILLKQRSVGCTLRKQPQALTAWFYEALSIYSVLWVRPDSSLVPVKGYLNELFGYLKFVALPNNVERKQDIIDNKWPLLKTQIDAL